jgi:hypothetical protein
MLGELVQTTAGQVDHPRADTLPKRYVASPAGRQVLSGARVLDRR